MKMTAFVAALLVAVAASNVFAGEPSHSSLSKMGLAGVAKMTDAQGMQVRGMGSIAIVGGLSGVATGNSHSGAAAGSFYLGATASSGPNSAGLGNSTSYATTTSHSAFATTTSFVVVGH